MLRIIFYHCSSTLFIHTHSQSQPQSLGVSNLINQQTLGIPYFFLEKIELQAGYHGHLALALILGT